MILNNLEDTARLAHEIARGLKTKDVVLLKGELGVGKTTLTTEIIRFLAKNPILRVTSPTFPILQIYELEDVKVYHFDLYRIKNIEEILELGFDEALESGICIIEWPEIIEHMLVNEPYKEINIIMLKDGSRKVEVNIIKPNYG